MKNNWKLTIECWVCFYLHLDKEIQVDLQEVDDEVAVKDMLQIDEPNKYEALQESLKLESNRLALVKVYCNIFATNADDFVDRIMEMTFKDDFILMIGFRNLNGIINVKETPLLDCWIGQFMLLLLVSSLFWKRN